MNRVAFLVGLVVAAGVVGFLAWPRAERDVTLYCSVDQDQSLAIVAEFEKATGLRVNYQGETEASRSVGIIRALEAEKGSPRADVLWANEIMNTVYLRERGLLAPLPASVAERFPPAWRDPKGTYVAF